MVGDVCRDASVDDCFKKIPKCFQEANPSRFRGSFPLGYEDKEGPGEFGWDITSVPHMLDNVDEEVPVDPVGFLIGVLRVGLEEPFLEGLRTNARVAWGFVVLEPADSMDNVILGGCVVFNREWGNVGWNGEAWWRGDFCRVECSVGSS